MNVFVLKLLAITTMVIDHIGLFFFPQELVFRMIGRLAFPLFAWLIANGAYHTRNIRTYVLRIFLLALVSQVPYLLANRQVDPSFSSLNVLFTLGLGLTAIMFIQRTNNRQAWVLIAVICGGVAHLLQADYGMFGVFMTVCFYLFFNNFKFLLLSQLLLFLIPYFFLAEYRGGSIEPIGFVALLFVWLYNKKQGLKAKYLFYVFYPVQYVVIYLLKLVV